MSPEELEKIEIKKNEELTKAYEYAKKAYKNKKYKFGGEDYINHPLRLLHILRNYTNSITMLQAALLHDVFEDGIQDLARLSNLFTLGVAELVTELTWNKKQLKIFGRKVYIAQKMSWMSKRAFLIKLCDRLENVNNLHKTTPEIAREYAEETLYIIRHLKRQFDEKEKEIIDEILEKIKPYLGENGADNTTRANNSKKSGGK